MKMRVFSGVVLVAAMTWSAGCASSTSKPVYDPTQTGTIMTIGKAEIIAVRDVDIKPTARTPGSTGPIGTVTTGAVTSAISGSIWGVARSVGTVVGNAVGSVADGTAGEEITLAIEGGKTVIVVQTRSEPPLAPGEKVLIVAPSSTAPAPIWGGRGSGGGLGGDVRVIRPERYAAQFAVSDR